MITKEQIRRINALGAGCGLLERGNKDDPLHGIVFSVSGKSSIKELTEKEFFAVQHELIERMKLSNHDAPLKCKARKEPAPGMMTLSQQDLAFRFIYRLKELDVVPSSATVGERMVGAIGKILGITAGTDEPFLWINFDSGEKLIEVLKKYVRSAERKAERAGVASAGIG